MTKPKSPLAFDDKTAPPIFVFRGESVVMDSDLAGLFDVETKRLNEQVKRNADKFGNDFAFQLTKKEHLALKSQIATSSDKKHGGRRKPPWMFTEHGVVMVATVLKSERAITASRFIVKVFVEARRNQLALSKGQNLPAVIDPRAVLPLGADIRHGMMAKLDAALGRVLDAIADPAAQTTVRDEAHAIAAEGLSAIKEHLKKQGFENEKTSAEVGKLLKEAEALDANISGKHIENRHRQLAYQAKQIRMVIEIQRYLETGSVEGLLSVLKDLGGA